MSTTDGDAGGSVQKLLYLVDWLPPDFGAVGQYALGFARTEAERGAQVTLVGFSSTAASEQRQVFGRGCLTVRRVHRPLYDRADLLRRAFWTVGANLSLLWAARREFGCVDEIRFTGSPPYLLHFVMPLARLKGVRTRYRISDFHPECLIAALDRAPLWLRMIYRLTLFWRRRVDVIEVLGEDQRRRILECGVAAARIELRRDPSPVEFGGAHAAARTPAELAGLKFILYSGNWGVAHEYQTFVDGLDLFAARHAQVAGLWLNATGARADQVESALRERGLAVARTRPVPLAELPAVLLAADLHLITLDDRFVGYVLPSKVYACVASGRPVLFIGSAGSDVDMICRQGLPAERYRRVDVGDGEQVAAALATLLLG